jgi:hypothetical protein
VVTESFYVSSVLNALYLHYCDAGAVNSGGVETTYLTGRQITAVHLPQVLIILVLAAHL